MCKEKRHNRKYTEEFRILVVKEYLSGGISKNALCKKHSIPQMVTLNSWLRKFVGDDPKENSMKKRESSNSETEEITRLKRGSKTCPLSGKNACRCV